MNTLITRVRAFVRRVFFWLPSAQPSEERVLEHPHDHALILAVTTPRKVPRWRQLRYAFRVLDLRERRIASISLAVFVISTGLALGTWVNARTIRVPAPGGTLIEALTGEPKYLNPIDAPTNDVDRDISSLVYSGLFRMDGMDVQPDLAEKYSWSDDGKTLTVSIRGDARFQNGDSVTAYDVQYTIDSIQDPARNSPLAPVFRGVKAIASDAQTVQFIFDQPSISFLPALTVGILPSQQWQDIPAANARLADLNLKPVGSGPYRFKSFTRDSRGLIRSFTLERYDGWYGVKPYIQTLVFQFFPDRKQAEDAFKAQLVDALAFTTLMDGQKTDSSRWNVVQMQLPQETIAFFNIKDNVLSDIHVRQALAGVIDRQEIVDAWNGHAAPVNGPFPFMDVSSTPVTLDQARATLDAAGWTLPQGGNIRVLTPKPKTTPTASSTTPLELTITTSDQSELSAVAEALKRRWSLLGVKVDINIVSPEELLRLATRDRKGQIILTNILLGPEQDLTPFWWSGQAVDRGLNISGTSDRDIDAALNQARIATTPDALQTANAQVSTAITKTSAAAFLIRPSYAYLVTKRIQGTDANIIISQPANRFQSLMHWYIQTGWRWK